MPRRKRSRVVHMRPKHLISKHRVIHEAEKLSSAAFAAGPVELYLNKVFSWFQREFPSIYRAIYWSAMHPLRFAVFFAVLSASLYALSFAASNVNQDSGLMKAPVVQPAEPQPASSGNSFFGVNETFTGSDSLLRISEMMASVITSLVVVGAILAICYGIASAVRGASGAFVW